MPGGEHREQLIAQLDTTQIEATLGSLETKYFADLAMEARLTAEQIRAESILFPDVTGHRPEERAIVAGAPPAHGRAPFAALLAAARSSRVPARLSRDAGRYLCNYSYWRALETASRSGTPLAQFIHIPPVARNPRRPGKKKRVSHAALARAGEAVLLALLVAQRRLG